MEPTKPTITICSSAAFYKHVVELEEQIEKLGLAVVVPDMAHQMKAANDYDVNHFKTWFANPGEYDKKAKFMHGHFDKVAAGDAILVVNDEKHGIANYIGGNVLMEMALAFHLRKPIFILHDYPAETAFDEEIHGMLPIILHNDISKLPEQFKQAATV